MNQSKFKKAEKKKSKLRLGIIGPSGSGKTYSALRLASGFGKKIAVIDTEKGSASLYADKFDFDVLELTPPYSPERYIEAMKAAVDEGYELIIMDSISHAWAGEGGLLQKKEQLDSRGGNSFQNWAKMTPLQEKFISALINCPAHLIVTMRSKQEYIMTENDKGKQAPKKVGLAPIQRDGFEYELTTVFDVAINHDCETSKDRTGLFTDKIFQITEETGTILKDWLESGVELKKEESQTSPQQPKQNTEQPKDVQQEAKKAVLNYAKISQKESLAIIAAMELKKISRDDILNAIKFLFNKNALKELTLYQAEQLIELLHNSYDLETFNILVNHQDIANSLPKVEN